jgi:hypothetical protein
MSSSIVIDPFSQESADGTLAGTTEVTIISAPASGVRRIVRSIVIHNRNNADVLLTVAVKNGVNNRIIFSATLETGDTFEFGDSDELFLNSTSKSVIAYLSAIPTTNPDFMSSWSDA